MRWAHTTLYEYTPWILVTLLQLHIWDILVTSRYGCREVIVVALVVATVCYRLHCFTRCYFMFCCYVAAFSSRHSKPRKMVVMRWNTVIVVSRLTWSVCCLLGLLLCVQLWNWEVCFRFMWLSGIRSSGVNGNMLNSYAMGSSGSGSRQEMLSQHFGRLCLLHQRRRRLFSLCPGHWKALKGFISIDAYTYIYIYMYLHIYSYVCIQDPAIPFIRLVNTWWKLFVIVLFTSCIFIGTHL